MNMAVRPGSVSVVNSCIVVMATNLLSGINGGLTLGKYCGDVMCPKYEYCNSDNMCDGCTKICDINSNNYEFENCERYCQDYIHDHIKSYVRASDFVQLKGTVETLQSLVVVSLTLSIFLILVIGIILLVAWYRYRQFIFNCDATTAKSKEIKKKMAKVNVISNNNDGPENRLALKIPPPVPESEQGCPQSAVTTTTPLSTRHPSEDNTLEYAYDNPALTPSPGTNLRRTETTF